MLCDHHHPDEYDDMFIFIQKNIIISCQFHNKWVNKLDHSTIMNIYKCIASEGELVLGFMEKIFNTMWTGLKESR